MVELGLGRLVLAQGADPLPVPEPPTILLMGLAALVPALVALWLRRRKKTR